MKKNIQKIKLTIALTTGLITGCETSLQEEVFSFISTENFYKTSEDAEAAVYAAYSPFLTSSYFGFQYYNLTLLADDQVTIGRNPTFQAVDNFNLTAEHPFVSDVWTQMYLCINRANTALARLPAIEMNESRKNSLLGEALYIRAYNYFNLVRLFGAIPLTTGEISTPGQTNTPKATKEEVYEQILSDLAGAEPMLPASRSGAEVGRITKGGAQILLAEVFLTLGRWSDAAAKAREVMDSGQYALLTDFEEIFSEDNENNSEIITSIQFDGPMVGTSYAAYAHGGGTDNPNTSIGAQVWSVEEKSDMWLNWSQADNRRNFSVYHEFINRSGNRVDLYNTARPFPAFGKYNSPNEAAQSKCPINPVVHRYPDVLFIFAEASAMAAGEVSEEAYEAVNRVRRRAYNLPQGMRASIDIQSGLSAEAFRDTVIRERSLEFVIENKRLFDLMRTNRFPAILKEQGKQINERATLFPIPQAEINANTALSQADQNEGY